MSTETMLTPYHASLVEHAFRTMDFKGDGLVQLDDICRVFDASKHPRVREGSMAPSAARDMLVHQFGKSARENGGVILDVFMRFHERMALEAENEQVGDVEEFLTATIEGVWRMGDLLQPTLIRPVTATAGMPTGIYATQAMSLVWPEQGEAAGAYSLRVVRDVVQPIFSRGDLPPQLRGFFAYPAELAGMRVVEVPAQISMKRWLDFAWAYEEGRYAVVPGIVSARVDPDTLPAFLRELIVEHDAATKLPAVRFLPTARAFNPMYKRSSDEYGYGVPEEVKRVHQWKGRTYDGTAYGLLYYGRFGNFTKTHCGHGESSAASGINL
ncbi:hypothetical protein DQ04_03981070 [Trypanosoma grayi]|uniref:hypothetical protein n=1 Tax=Trypanosoma grayi TaxID=71804 RepID=UPI0004F49195|nr:hypothetical protein DQ04_03981070 [Trypanosoma grayi]KEG10254.1 hypothetical protein DQ04_03981070 [Trypanosoma grayi]